MNTRTIINTPYYLTRAPLTVLDAAVANRLAEDSAPRVLLDRTIGSFDRAAGRLLSDKAITQRGSDRLERSAKLAEAATLEQQAAQKRRAADATAARGKQKAARQAEAAEDRTRQAFADAEKTEREGAEQGAAQARDLAAQKKERAEARKQQRVDAIQRDLDNDEAKADAVLTRAQKTAKAKLDDAAQTRAAADEDKAKADQLGDLTAAKRRARKQD